jgi:hypothetical protein
MGMVAKPFEITEDERRVLELLAEIRGLKTTEKIRDG